MPYYFGNPEKISFGILCGVIVFGLFTNLAGRVFEKSDQQKAEESCATIKRTIKALSINGDFSSGSSKIVSINGKDYKCN